MKTDKQLMEDFVFEAMLIHDDLKKKRIECDKAGDVRAGRIIHEGELTAQHIVKLAHEHLLKMKG